MLVKQVRSSYIIVLLTASQSIGDIATWKGSQKLREEHMQIQDNFHRFKLLLPENIAVPQMRADHFDLLDAPRWTY